ncbi:hypothetical protein ACN47E_005378 [Coniothyrium glycines]
MASKKIQFSNDYTRLPATSPADHAHIVVHGAQGHAKALVQDAIVTMLYYIDPTILTRFLVADFLEFKLLLQYKDPSLEDRVVIMRRGNQVVIGVVREHPELNTLEFDNLVRLTVGAAGNWTVTYTSYRDYFAYNWNDVWTGRTKDPGPQFSWLTMRATVTHDPERVFEMFPAQISEMILGAPMWDSAVFKWTFTVF